MMRRRNLWRGLGWLVLSGWVMLWAIACSPQPTAQAPTVNAPLLVAVSPWVGYRGQYIAMAKNLFAPEGITVDEKAFQSAPDLSNSLIAGKVDLAWLAAADLLTMTAQAPSLKIIMASDYSNGGDGILGRNINSPADMKGKKVAREDAPYAMVFLGTYLAKAGLTEKDLQIISLAPGDAATAFLSNRVDAATTYEPWLTQAKDSIIYSSKDTNAIPIVLAARAETIQNRRTEILAYMKAIDKALVFADSNPQEANEIIAKNLGVTAADIPAQLAAIYPFTIATNKSEAFNPNHPLSLVTSLNEASKILSGLGKIPQPIDATTLVDDSLVKAL